MDEVVMVREKLAELEMRAKSNEHRINEIVDNIKIHQEESREEFAKLREENKALYELSASIKTLNQTVVITNEKIDDVKEKQEAMNTKITALENAPAKEALKFNKSVKEKIIMAVVMAIVGFAIGIIFPFTI